MNTRQYAESSVTNLCRALDNVSRAIYLNLGTNNDEIEWGEHSEQKRDALRRQRLAEVKDFYANPEFVEYMLTDVVQSLGQAISTTLERHNFQMVSSRSAKKSLRPIPITNKDKKPKTA